MTDRPSLTVYMPVVHGGRAKGFARSLAHIGATMRVTGKTMTFRSHFDVQYTKEEARHQFGANVDTYEDDEIERHPPDVMIVGREDNEMSMLGLWRQLNRIKPVVFLAYSGVVQSNFTFNRFHGVIATDVATRALARYHGVPALKFYPYFWFDQLPFTPEPERDTVVLRSFIVNYAKRFPLAYGFHEKVKAVLAQRFGSRVLVENIEGVTHDDVREFIVDSTATLHIKDLEGFGWSCLESLSTGRPLIVQAGLARNMAYREWMIDRGEGFIIDEPADAIPVVERLLSDPAWRARVQRATADRVRRIFPFEKDAEALGAFFDNLIAIEKLRWAPWKRGKRLPVAPFRPTLDPEALQDFEVVALNGRKAETFPDM